MMPRKIKLFWRVGAVLAALTAVAVAAAVLVPRMGVSDLYRRYEGNPHLDVTLLQARDDEGWDTLRADFRIRQLPEHTQNKIDSGQDIVSVRIVLKSNPAFPMDTVDMENNVVVGISRLNRVVSIFNTDTEKQIDAILHYNYEKNIQTNK